MSTALQDDNANIHQLRSAITGLNLRIQELAINEARGHRTNTRLRRYLTRQKIEAHRALKLALGKPRH